MTNEKIMEAVENMNVLEVVDFVKTMKNKFSVSAEIKAAKRAAVTYMHVRNNVSRKGDLYADMILAYETALRRAVKNIADKKAAIDAAKKRIKKKKLLPVQRKKLPNR